MLPTRVHWSLCVLTCMLIDPYCTVLYGTVLYCTGGVCVSTMSVHLLIHALMSSSSTCASLYMLPTWLHWSLCVLTCLLIDPYHTVLYCTVLYCTVLYSFIPYCQILVHVCSSICPPTRVNWSLCVLTCMLIDPYCTVLYCTVLYCTVLYWTCMCQYNRSVHLLIHALLWSSSTCTSLYMLPTRVHWSLCVRTCMLIDPYCTVLYCTVLYCTCVCAYLLSVM